MKLLLILQLLVGIGLAVVMPQFHQAEVIALVSDFKAFGARVQADDAAAHVLIHGGEDCKESYQIMVERLAEHGDAKIWMPGMVMGCFAVIGLAIPARGRFPVD